MKQILFASIVLFAVACNNNHTEEVDPNLISTASNIPAPQNINFSIIAKYPHDTSAFTQGLQLYKGKMYEGTGDYAESSLRITDYKTGKVEQKHMMGTSEIFGEGITILNEKIYQLTWESNKVFVYNVNDITKPIQTFDWPHEGWGITNNGRQLIISDGVTSNLYFVDPVTFKVNNTISVESNQGKLMNMNELEFIDGYVYANIWQTASIAKIDPNSGHVVGMMNFSNLLTPQEYVVGRTEHLNGIAYDSTSKTMFITGKRWPWMWELQLN